MNRTQASSCFNPTAEAIGKTLAYCLLFVVSLAGNTFIGVIVYKTKTMRKPINFFIVNMAMSDLLFPIFFFPPILAEMYVDSWLISGPLGHALCKLVFFVTHVSVAVSIQSLVLIAVDRFGAVVFPLRSPLISSKLCPIFILVTWINAMAIQSPYLFAMKVVEYPEELMCERKWSEAFGESSSLEKYSVATFIVLFYAPLALITVLYIIIHSKLKSQKIPGEPSVKAGQQRMKRERNVLKMSIAIVLVFAVCWLPHTIYWVLVLFFGPYTSCGFKYFAYFAFFLAHSYCAINPCICFIFSGNYRQGLKNLLSCALFRS